MLSKVADKTLRCSCHD